MGEQKLALNIEKTKIMVISNRVTSAAVAVDDEITDQINSYKYFGSVINCKGNAEGELNMRISQRIEYITHLEINFWSIKLNKDSHL